MKVLVLCGVFAEQNEQEVIAHSKRPVEFSANVFQKKLIRGLRAICEDVQVLSAPFVGSFPNASDLFAFSGFSNPQDLCSYVPFLNLWGVRNWSRASSLKKALEAFAMEPDPQKLIVAYSPHTPFLEAAADAKKKDPNIKICLVVPDLPQYMNLDAKISWAYRIGKRYDIARFNELTRYVDTFILLTEAMAKKLRVGDKPYKVVEGIVEQTVFDENEKIKQTLCQGTREEKYIVYTGKTNERFGVKKLVDAFSCIENPSLRLVLCGKGDCDEYIKRKTIQDKRILAMGQVPHNTAKEWVMKADVLVNPRENNEEYTKYSFPSKTIEYLASGNPTVGYMLDGMPKIYGEFLFLAEQEGLSQTIESALNATADEKAERKQKARAYLESLSEESLASAIINISTL